MQTQTESTVLTDPNLQPPPPPPPPVELVRSDSDSSDDDDGLQPWHAVHEDTSTPDELELKEIEASEEHSALDHEYWESNAFLPLEEPEYTARESGRIDWVIDAYNGTREQPNRDIVMKSDVVTVGGHQWQIKFYPKGNDSDYLSVYLDCLSVMDPKKKEPEDAQSSDSSSKEDDASEMEEKLQDKMETTEPAPTESTCPSESPVDPQHAPLPLLGSKVVPKRKCVAAQVSVVLYNPTEPRVHYSKTALHRFCGGSPDWGWTRFHGPYYDIAHRMRGHRSALLRDDKLAFTGYIRIVEDETNCLWEHHSSENQWDSFAMTGLQSLILGQNASAPGGNMISAVASWLLFKPFREVLYNIKVADPKEELVFRPKPLIAALQKVLYMLRTQVDPGAGPVALNDVLEALDWYGISDRLDKFDVMKVWEVFRTKLEEELQHTTHAGVLQSMFGPKRDYTKEPPLYRVPIIGVHTMQAAVNSSTNFIMPGQSLPQLLTIELDRQVFDVKTRSYVKVLNKVTLDDRLMVGDTNYTLYGFVVHKQTLQSYVYQPIIRPEGPGSRWYRYSDSKEENQVRCLTKRQALDEHEGKPSDEQVIGNDAVAYIVMYVRDDLAQAAFTCDPSSEDWQVPEWICKEIQEKRRVESPEIPPPMPPLPVETSIVEIEADAKPPAVKPEELATMMELQVLDSRIFKDHRGPGCFDAYDQRLKAATSEYVHDLTLKSTAGCADIIDALAPLFPVVKDSRQILFWFLDPTVGSLSRPKFFGTGKTLYSRGQYDRYTENQEWTLAQSPVSCRRMWVHIIDFADLPEIPVVKEEEPQPEVVVPELLSVEEMRPEPSDTAGSQTPTQPPSGDTISQVEDTPMSEPEDVAPVPSEPLSGTEIDIQHPIEEVENTDAAMIEVESAELPDPPVVDVLVPEESPVPGDTEMGGTQNELPPPPPPPIDFPAEPAQPPPPERAQTPDLPPEETYFFLKLWDAEKQTLESKGSHLVFSSARVDETVVKLLGLSIEDKKKIEMWQEDKITSTRPVKHRRSFSQLDIGHAAIIIASLPITAEQRTALSDRAAFVEPQAYLAHCAATRNFPGTLDGHFTYNYFSGQYYKGEVKNGHRHGHGTLIYHSGATYSGSFRLGLCHGHGLYTFQNGDTYDGDWVDNQQHGSGTFVEAATGNTYMGGWKNDKKFGEGVTHWKNAQEAERLCRICWDEPAEAAFYDCGHVVACLGCAREVQNCPVCRKRVLSAMKLYYVA
jgi:hypothetical protein